MSVQLVLCTCPTREVAAGLARSLVEQRLAACVNLLPGVQSVYRWQGGIHTDEEVLLLIKTHALRLEALKAHVLAQHPYELPEILVVQVDSGLDRYLQWIGDETSAPAP